MASQGKKGKKSKGKTLNLTEFLSANEGGGGPTTTVTLPKSSWADEMDEMDDYPSTGSGVQQIVLPTAPRAARGPDIDDDCIPRDPPFTAHIGNLPFDIDEEEVLDFFARTLKIKSVRLPRDGDASSGRLKGFGYADFEDRASLVEALTMDEQTLKNRKIKVSLATHAGGNRDGGRDGGNRRRYENPEDDRTMGDWRSGPAPERPADDRSERRDRYDNNRGSRSGRYDDRGDRRSDDRRDDRRDNRGYGFDRQRSDGFDRQRSSNDDFDRSQMRTGDRESERRETFDRRDDRRDGGRDDRRDGGGYERRGNDRYGDRSNDRYGDRRNGGRYGDRENRDQGREQGRDSEPARERPKLQLAKRTVDKPSDDKPAASASIFGGAKPVDTTKKEREIEQKLKSTTIEPKNEEPVKKSVDIFGAAKPVDTAAKEREIEEKLRKRDEEMRKREDDNRDEKETDKRPPRRIELPDRERDRDHDNRPNSRGSDPPRRGHSPPRRGQSPPRRGHRDGPRDDRREPEKIRNNEKPEGKIAPKGDDGKPPNFVGSNKFSYLADEDENTTGTSGQDSE